MLPLQLLRAWRQQDELGEVAIENGEIGDLPGVEARGDVGAIRGQQRRTAGDRDLLGELADLERELHRRLRIDADDDLGYDRRLETGELRLHAVFARQETFLQEQS